MKILDGQGQLVKKAVLRFQENSPVTFIAPYPTEYSFIITSLDPASTKGSYQATVIDKHIATEEDEIRVKAEQLFEDGERLKAEWNTPSLRLAAEKFAQAAKSRDSIKEWWKVLYTWITIGEIYQ